MLQNCAQLQIQMLRKCYQIFSFDDDLCLYEFSRKSGVGSRKSEVGSRKSDVGSRMSEIGCRKLDVGGQKSEDRSPKTEDRSRKIEVRSWMLEVGCRESEDRSTIKKILTSFDENQIICC